MNTLKAILLPGNGGGTPQDNWFPYLETELPKFCIDVINTEFPDPVLARKSFWIPFLHALKANKQTILIGHSSGAIASLRFAEKNKILGSILVGSYHSNLNMESEKQSGYFDQPWNWTAIRNNQKWIIQFNSTDDPFIPIEEARLIHNKLNTDYYEYTDKQHFGHGNNPLREIPELVEALKKHL